MYLITEQQLQKLFDSSDDEIIDLRNTICDVQTGLVLNKVNSKWREIHGLSLISTALVPIIMLTIPRWSGTWSHRSFVGCSLRGNKITTAIDARATGITWDKCQILDHKIGLNAKGLNLNRFINCLLRGNETGILAEHDSLIGAGGVGNDNRFLNCDIRGNNIGVQAIINNQTVGGSPGNNWQFSECVIENNKLSIDLQSGFYWRFSGGRFEAANGEKGLIVGNKAQHTRLTETIVTGENALVIEPEAKSTRLTRIIFGSIKSVVDNSKSSIYEGCNIIPDSNTSYASLYDITNTAKTQVGQSWGQNAKLNWNSTLGLTMNFVNLDLFTLIPGELRYEGKEVAKFNVNAIMSISSNETIAAYMRFAIDGVSQTRTQTKITLNSGNVVNVHMQSPLILKPGNVLSVQITRGAGIDPYVNLQSGQFYVEKISA